LEYFDITGGNDIDFLEFVISVWNVCALNPETLSDFAFDLYDRDSDGEISYPEMECMIEELYGKTGKRSTSGKQCLADLTYYAETQGGALSLDNCAYFTAHHSMLLLPAFQIQQAIQRRVMGPRYWEKVREQHERRVAKHLVGIHVYNPRYVQILLRTYKAKSAAAIMTHTGDPNEALRQWFERAREARALNISVPEPQQQQHPRSLWRMLGDRVLDSQRLKGLRGLLQHASDSLKMKKARQVRIHQTVAIKIFAST